MWKPKGMDGKSVLKEPMLSVCLDDNDESNMFFKKFGYFLDTYTNFGKQFQKTKSKKQRTCFHFDIRWISKKKNNYIQ